MEKAAQTPEEKSAKFERDARSRHRKDVVGHWLKTVLFTCALLLFAGLFGYLAKASLTDALTQRASAGWPTVPGVLTEVGVATDNSGGDLHYVAVATYRYRVDKTTYAGDRIRMVKKTFTERQQVLDAIANYRRGGRVTVRYNPADPSVALLEPGMETADWQPAALPGGMAALFVLSVLILLFRAVKNRPRYDYEAPVDLFQQAMRKNA